MTLRSLTVPNRIWMAATCQSTAPPDGEQAGVPNDGHFAHLAARATGGTGLILTEPTAVSPEGRTGPYDLGIWNDTQVEAFHRIATFLKSQGTVPGIQLAAGHRDATEGTWVDRRFPGSPGRQYGWAPAGPTAVPFGTGSTTPEQLSTEQIGRIVADFADAARRAQDAGFQVAEIHGVHGYLINQFLSPHTNRRTDGYGGEFAGRTRFALEVVDAVRAVWPQDLPVFFRTSDPDWPEEITDDTLRLAKELQARGVDLMDVPTGGDLIRNQTGMPVAAVGPLTGPAQAQAIVRSGQADAVLLGQELRRDPYWALRAATSLGGKVRTRRYQAA
ncbi:NADH:flavin oxidoreductase/NADH oxidase [Streptomyces sp. NPDC006207]